jgi:hypothetical protein
MEGYGRVLYGDDWSIGQLCEIMCMEYVSHAVITQ